MKKVVYLAPIFLLSFLGKNAMAGQVEHVSKLDEALKEEAIAKPNVTAQTTAAKQTQANQEISTNLLNTKRDNNSVADINTYTASKIDAQAVVPVVINNPAGDKVHVHYIDSNGNAVDNSTHDYDIDATKTGQGSYTVPNGYSLNVPDGKYNVNGGKFSATNFYATVNSHVDRIKTTGTGEEEVEVDKEHDGSGSDVVPDPTDSEVEQALSTSDTDKPGFKITYVNVVDRVEAGGIGSSGSGVVEFTCDVSYEYDKYTNVTTYVQHLPVAFVDSNNNIVGMVQNYSGKVGTTQNVSLTVPTGYKLADGATLPTSVTFQNSTNPLLVKVAPNGTTQSISTDSMHVHFVDQSTGKAVGGDYTISVNDNGSYYYQTPKGYGADHNGYRISVSTSTEYTGLSASNLSYPDGSSISLSMSNNAIKQMYDYFGKDASVAIGPSAGTGSEGGEIVAVYDFDHAGNGKRVLIDPDDDDIPEWQRELSNQVFYSYSQFGEGLVWLLSPKTTQVTKSRRFTDNLHTISGNTVTVPVHKTNSFTFSDNSGNVKSYSGNTVNVILEHQTKRIDPNNSSLNLDANNQLHLINTNQAQPKQSTTNFKVGYLLDLVTNNKTIDTNNVQALNNTKIFTVNPSLPIGYDALNTKLLTLNL